MLTVKLNKPYRHAAREYPAGEILSVSSSVAKLILEGGYGVLRETSTDRDESSLKGRGRGGIPTEVQIPTSTDEDKGLSGESNDGGKANG